METYDYPEPHCLLLPEERVSMGGNVVTTTHPLGAAMAVSKMIKVHDADRQITAELKGGWGKIRLTVEKRKDAI